MYKNQLFFSDVSSLPVLDELKDAVTYEKEEAPSSVNPSTGYFVFHIVIKLNFSLNFLIKVQ